VQLHRFDARVQLGLPSDHLRLLRHELPVPVPPSPGADVGGGEPGPGADVDGVRPERTR
jgi:hypothetical protein